MSDEIREEVVKAFMHNLVTFVSKVGDIVKDEEVSHMEQVMQIGHELSDLRQASVGLHDMVLIEENQVTLN